MVHSARAKRRVVGSLLWRTPVEGVPILRTRWGWSDAVSRSRPVEGDEMRSFWFAAEE
jgi:hypothetical protein